MRRYNSVISVGVAVNATSPEAAKRAIQANLEFAIQHVDMPDFVVTDMEVMGIFDIDWNETDATD